MTQSNKQAAKAEDVAKGGIRAMMRGKEICSRDESVIIHFIVFHKMIEITEALYNEDIANIYEDKDYLI